MAPPGIVRERIAADEVILSRDRPHGRSALNTLPATRHERRTGEGPGAPVALDPPAGRGRARITRRSAEALGLAPGQSRHAIVKSVATAPEDVGRSITSETGR